MGFGLIFLEVSLYKIPARRSYSLGQNPGGGFIRGNPNCVDWGRVYIGKMA